MNDDFIAGLVIGAGCVAHAFVGMPGEALSVALYNIRQEIVTGFAKLGDEYATQIADAFVAAVSESKSEIEAAKSKGPLQ